MESGNENITNGNREIFRPIFDKKLFENDVSQEVLRKWFEINDRLGLSVIDRLKYQKMEEEGKVIQTRGRTKLLSLPNDLQLFEIPKIVEIVDMDTFPDQPEKQIQRKEKIISLGKLFKNSAIYIYSRLNSIDQGKMLATSLVTNFMEYGYALENGRKMEKTEMLKNLMRAKITQEETEAVDKFLAGESLFESRRIKAESESNLKPDENKEEIYESWRRKTLASFFRNLDKSIQLNNKNDRVNLGINENEEPWKIKTPVHTDFLQKVIISIVKKAELPKTDLYASIYDRGERNLLEKMKEKTWRRNLSYLFKKIGIKLELSEKTLYETLDIPSLKRELEVARQNENSIIISQKEREIAEKIQNKIKKLPYFIDSNIPSDMVNSGIINCVGASILGGALMSEVGLNYLVADVPGHSLLVLITDDGGVEWRDMLLTLPNERLSNDMINGSKFNGSKLTLSDIVQYSKNPIGEGIRFEIDKSKYPNKFTWITSNESQLVKLFEPKYGQQYQIMNNIGAFLMYPWKNNKNYYEKERNKAIQFTQELIKIFPNTPDYHLILANLLLKNGQEQKAVHHYQQVISLDPNNTEAYLYLGKSMDLLGQTDAAKKVFDKAIELTPKESYFDLGSKFLLLGYSKEAVKFFEKVLEDNNLDPILTYKMLSAAYFAENKIDEVEKLFSKIRTLDPNQKIGYYTLVEIFKNMGDKNNEMKTYYYSIKENPTDKDNYINLVLILNEDERFDEAIDILVSATNNGIKDRYIYELWISNLSFLKRFNEAIHLCNQQLAINPKSAEIYDLLGYCLRSINRKAESKEALLMALKFYQKKTDLLSKLKIDMIKIELNYLE